MAYIVIFFDFALGIEEIICIMREQFKQEKHYANNFESTRCKYTPIHTGYPLRNIASSKHKRHYTVALFSLMLYKRVQFATCLMQPSILSWRGRDHVGGGVGTDQKQLFIVNFPTHGIRTQFKVPHLGMMCLVQSYSPEQELQSIRGKRICVSIARIAKQN